MNKFIIVVFSLISFVASGISTKLNTEQESDNMISQGPTVYYLIRHAEKMDTPGDSDPQLSEEGFARAEQWANYFNEIPLDEIYSTNYKRTQSTASKVSENKNLQVMSYSPDKAGFDLVKSRKGKSVLVVGHSNTTPALANYLLESDTYKQLDESEYSWLYIVTVDESGKTTSERKKIE